MTTIVNQGNGQEADQRRTVLIFVASALISTAMMGLLWWQFPYFAFLVVLCYLLAGGVRGVPTEPNSVAVAVGIFLGIALSAIVFYILRFLHVF